MFSNVNFIVWKIFSDDIVLCMDRRTPYLSELSLRHIAIPAYSQRCYTKRDSIIARAVAMFP